MQQGKKQIAILGTGNIGTDLLFKVLKSSVMNCALFIGRRDDSANMKLARKLNIPTSKEGIKAIKDAPQAFSLVFDATSAQDHKLHAPILEELGIPVIDLTPAKIGTICIPAVNGKEMLHEKNINLITCGGQASIPMAYAISQVQPNINYMEVVTTVASVCAGAATRANIDEYLQTTEYALRHFTGCKQVKAMLNLNPAVPEINMQVTIKLVIDKPDLSVITQAARVMQQTMALSVPGYQFLLEPTLADGHIVMILSVTGAGDYLPTYAGCLDIITQAAIQTGEHILGSSLSQGVNHGA